MIVLSSFVVTTMEQEPEMNVLASTPVSYGSINSEPPPPGTLTSEATEGRQPPPPPPPLPPEHRSNWQGGPLYYSKVSVVARLSIFLLLRVLFFLLNVNTEPRPVDHRFPIDRR